MTLNPRQKWRITLLDEDTWYEIFSKIDTDSKLASQMSKAVERAVVYTLHRVLGSWKACLLSLIFTHHQYVSVQVRNYFHPCAFSASKRRAFQVTFSWAQMCRWCSLYFWCCTCGVGKMLGGTKKVVHPIRAKTVEGFYLRAHKLRTWARHNWSNTIPHP